MELLKLQHLKKYFSNHKAVDDVSFSINQGEIFGLLGPNGAGKTTLIRMITGITYPDEGEIFLDGRKLNPSKDTARIGYMPEERGLYKKMKVGEHAVFLARLKGLSKADATKKVQEWFSKLHMESWWNKKVQDLSKGMSQKLQFISTVLHNPSLIILDEPFSGLDPLNANLIKDEIYNLAKNGSTVIFSTHRMEQVEEICDKIVLINLGKKILDGTVKGVKQQYRDNHFFIKIRNQNIDFSDAPFEIIKHNNSEIIIRLNESMPGNNVLRYLLEKEAEIESFSELLPSLNDIFIKLVNGTNAVSRTFE
ncbi:ABC transporter ATP-binding protein [Haoranjiania flava]|uniref:ATP-binding cassette domain-containing protein n=1 Tax=Haoranjiania flava TaxID=1856322 RepID=A0AAE3IT74_9BACT|nr:ATP-binding cassette domain-containing protein [Haoranjiania flava]MCU7695387.1 ATP-binding cassette domain-containing protein [Haoranjiania flava]